MNGTNGTWARKSIAAVAALGLAAIPTGVAAQSGDDTFACDPGFYQVISGQLASLSPGTESYTLIGPDHSNYNAMGYRYADGFMYGMSGKTLHRIDAKGNRFELGQLEMTSRGSYTGDFGDDGLLHISRGGGDWHKVDVDTMEAIRIDELSVYKAVADVTNVNGKFYGVSSDGILYIYDPIALTVEPSGTVDGLPDSRKAYGAAWSTAGGNLYIGRNTGEIYQITGYSTGTPKATKVGQAPPTNSNDGGSCAFAPVQPGLTDVDGPKSETPPSTPEGEKAAEEYENEYEEHEKGFVEPEPEPEPEPVEPEPVVVSGGDPEPVEDAGIGQGAGCEASTIYDREARAELTDDDFVKVDAPKVLFESGFDGTEIANFTLLSGNWNMYGGAFSQLNACGFDYSAILDGVYVNSFRWESTFSAISGDNQGGLLINQSAQDTRSGAMVIDLAEGGSRLRWGSYNNAGYYEYADSIAIEKPATGVNVKLAVEVMDSKVSIFLNGELVATAESINSGGMVGLIASETDVAFDHAILTALPKTTADAAPEAETETTPDTAPSSTEPPTTEPTDSSTSTTEAPSENVEPTTTTSSAPAETSGE